MGEDRMSTEAQKAVIETRNPAYTEHGTIDLEIKFPDGVWRRFTASPDDVMDYGRELFELNKDLAAPYVPPVPPVPPAEPEQGPE